MSLVAYEASSDEESECEQSDRESATTKVVLIEKKSTHEPKVETSVLTVTNGHISDDDEDYLAEPTEEQSKASTFSLALPKPKKETTIQDILQDIPRPPFQVLPMPKAVGNETVAEEDDEFLHKKDKFIATETKPPPKVLARGPVKIYVPSLEEFRDVEKDMGSKTKNATSTEGKSKLRSGLLGLLPQAKSERSFSKPEKLESKTDKVTPELPIKSHSPAFIPDTVKYRRPAHNTEEIGGAQSIKKVNRHKVKPQLVNGSDSEASDEEDANAVNGGQDYFSFASDDCLPEVSANEISALVAKKAAKMAEATNKYLADAESKAAQEAEQTQSNLRELELARKRYHEQQLDSQAVQALVGSSAKRRRNYNEPINVMDLNSDEIMPNRDEWMRTALASSTVYQPTGVMVDEEPAAGTRRKHQITYLAHKAKTNEAELQAMWAANRQNRRATQSKYGF